MCWLRGCLITHTIHLFRLNPWLLELDSGKWRPEQGTLKISLQLILNSPIEGRQPTSMAKRSYPTSEVRGRSREDRMPQGHGQEELPHVRGQGQGPRVSGYDCGGAAERSYPTFKIRGGGQEKLPTAWDQGPQPGGATPCPRSGAAAERRNPTSKERWLHRHRRA